MGAILAWESPIMQTDRHLVQTYSVVVCEEGRVFRANKLGDEVEIGALFVLAMEGLL